MGGLNAPCLFSIFTTTLVLLFFTSGAQRDLEYAAEDGTESGLELGFYEQSCPRAEEIVREIVEKHCTDNPNLAASLIRLLFHDCFIRGCDASLLLDSTPDGGTVEKNSPANLNTLRGLEVIDEVKAALEAECPATVSCADILAFAARDAATFSGLASYSVPAGRRDGTVSRAEETMDLPNPGLNASAIIDVFAKKNFSATEVVVLFGAHSIGGAHCKFFKDRLYNFEGEAGEQDPSLEPVFAEVLKRRCPRIDPVKSFLDSVSKVPFEFVTSHTLDVMYYSELKKGKGLLGSDQALMTDERTREVVDKMAGDPRGWADQFRRAMVKLGALDVLVGDQGEIRKECRFVN